MTPERRAEIDRAINGNNEWWRLQAGDQQNIAEELWERVAELEADEEEADREIDEAHALNVERWHKIQEMEADLDNIRNAGLGDILHIEDGERPTGPGTGHLPHLVSPAYGSRPISWSTADTFRRLLSPTEGADK